MAGLVYTAIFGNYDTPKEVKPETGVTYWMFTDGKPAKGWQPKLFDKPDNPVRRAREIKVLTPALHPAFDWYLWLDGSMQPSRPLKPLIDKLLESEHDFAAFKHNEWWCAFREIEACRERNKDSGAALTRTRKLLDGYRFPPNFGHAATGVLWRRDTNLVRMHARAWWSDMLQSTMRDQCTFMLNCWKQKAYVEWIPGLHTKNSWIKYYRGHK